jgi:hypothetical protein
MNHEAQNSYRDLQAALTQFAQCISVLAGDDRTRHEVMVEESRPILKAALAALAKYAGELGYSTPRTDAMEAKNRHYVPSYEGNKEMIALCRQLERELAEMTEAMREWRDKCIEKKPSSTPENDAVKWMREVLADRDVRFALSSDEYTRGKEIVERSSATHGDGK